MASDKVLAAKQKHVEELVEALKGSTTYVFVSSRGLTVEQDTVLRSDLRKAGVQFKVIKNTTLKLVFEKLGFSGLEDTFKGPTTVAFSNDLIAPAKVIAKYAEDYEPLEIKSAIIDGKISTAADVIALSKVPDPTTLYTQVAYSMLFPFTKLAMLVKAVAEKNEENSGASAPAAEEAAAPAETPAE